MPTAAPASQTLAGSAGFLTSETVGSSLLPLRTWAHVGSRRKASLGHLPSEKKTEGQRRRQMETDTHVRAGGGSWRATWALTMCTPRSETRALPALCICIYEIKQGQLLFPEL